MPEPTSIVAFITAQFDREYRDAQLISNGGYRPQRWEVAARGGEWPFATCMSEIIAHDQINTETWDQPHEQNRMALVDDGRNQDEHIARYDPQRICLEIEAKRRILAHLAVSRRDIEGALEKLPADVPIEVGAALMSTYGMIGVLEKHFAAPYADQPGFRPEWRIDA